MILTTLARLPHSKRDSKANSSSEVGSRGPAEVPGGDNLLPPAVDLQNYKQMKQDYYENVNALIKKISHN